MFWSYGGKCLGKESAPPPGMDRVKLGLLQLDDILTLQLTSFIYACINKLVPAVIDNYVTYISNIHDNSTGQAARGDIIFEWKNTLQYAIKSVSYAVLNHRMQYLLKLESLPLFQPLGPVS